MDMTKVKAILRPSPENGKRVRYVDRLRVVHTGEVVGQNKSGTWLYVRSLRQDAPSKEWHFKITAKLLPLVTTP
jgi:hypothetical protein